MRASLGGFRPWHMEENKTDTNLDEFQDLVVS